LSGEFIDPLPIRLSLKVAKVLTELSAAILFLSLKDSDKEEANRRVKEAQERMDELLTLVETSIQDAKEQRGQ
jgi:hypothetical protein